MADTQRQTGQGPGAGLMTGNVSPGFESVRSLFQRYLESDPFYSAQLSVYHRGEQVVDLCGGPHLALDSVTGLFSASKGLAGIAFATLIEEGLIELDRPVAHYWPEFGVKGKGRIEVRQLLSHSAGLLGVDGGFLDQEVLESSPAAARIAAEHPIWRPGTALGYHGLTIGLFLEELTRRVTGGSLQELYESRIRAPRGIDAYLGLPESEEKRFVVVGPLRVVGGPAAGPAPSPDGLAGFAFNNVNNPVPLEQIYLSPNTRAVRAAGPASLGGVGSARGVARAYATLLGHVGDPVLSGETIAAISQQQAWGGTASSTGSRRTPSSSGHRTPSSSSRATAASGTAGPAGRSASPTRSMTWRLAMSRTPCRTTTAPPTRLSSSPWRPARPSRTAW